MVCTSSPAMVNRSFRLAFGANGRNTSANNANTGCSVAAAVARVAGVDCTACHTARRDGSARHMSAKWSINSSRISGHCRAGTWSANLCNSATVSAVSSRSNSQISTYLLAKNWYNVPIGTSARFATSSNVNDSNPISTSTLRAAASMREYFARDRCCAGRRRG